MEEKIKRIFNVIDLTTAIKKGKATPKTLKKEKKTSFKPTKKKLDDIDSNIISITDRTVLEAQEGSVKKYIDQCHPDIRNFIEQNKAKTITAKVGQLIVVTENKIRIVITTKTAYSRHVKIVDHKRNILFDGLTTIKIEAVKKIAA